jgi:hypothetical protein
MSVGAWEPFWLETNARCLYAALHRPAVAAGSTGVLLVPPLLHEQPRSRRFVTEVASGLAALGLPCLRFDFSGTGDSSGSGEELDFATMRGDLDLALAGLRSRTALERLAVLAWRGAALPVQSWLDDGRDADLLVLWEPIADGSRWLEALVRDDASERAARPRPRPGVARLANADDGQLMGFPVSIRLRRDLAQARLLHARQAHGVPTWAVLRGDAPSPGIEVERSFPLPAGAPTFDGGAHMEATFFLSPPLERVVDALGRALLAVDEHSRMLPAQSLR